LGVKFNKIDVPRQLAGLTDRIRHIEYGTDPVGQAWECVVGSARVSLVISLRGAMLEGKTPDKLAPLPRFTVAGPWVRGRVWKPDGPTEILVVQLHELVLERLFGIHPAAVHNASEPLSLLTRCSRLPEALEEAGASRAKVMSALVAETTGAVAPSATPEMKVFDALQSGSYGWRVKNYTHPFGVCARTLERRIRGAFGVTPKQILGMGRMGKMVRLTESGWNRRVSDLAATLDYFDQSHMRHDLTRLDMGDLTDVLIGGHKIGAFGDKDAEKTDPNRAAA